MKRYRRPTAAQRLAIRKRRRLWADLERTELARSRAELRLAQAVVRLSEIRAELGKFRRR